MGKSLIIAEKPSVAADIARALGGFTKVGDHLESEDHVLTSAVGHLVEIDAPEDQQVKRGKWSFAHLPVIPTHFELRPIEKNEQRLRLLTRLIKRKDVADLINACDAGREGELIFRYITQYAGSSKPVRRLWLQSMTREAIRDGFEHLKRDEAVQGLAAAAVCRSEADWLVGINGTRAMTAFNSKSGGFQLTTVGRVQTPTLAILVEREEKIRAFVARDYWEVLGTFAAPAGEYKGRWFDEAFEKAHKEADPDARPERLWDRARAEAIRDRCHGKPGEVTEEAKPSSQGPPLLYDLTSLQREANGRFGFSAKTTLGLAQALYEKHKVLTYPRTDSRFLPQDYPAEVRKTLAVLAKSAYEPFARRVLDEGWVRPGNRRVFDQSKVSDHFAIIPTLQAPRHLSEIEAKLYDLVVKRFLAVFFPNAEWLNTTRITRVAGEPFKSEGRVLVSPGWLAVYGREAQGDETPMLPPVEAASRVLAREVEVQASRTKPPPRYTEATLLSAMEGAGKLIDDEDLRAAMSEKGLGTPATRAQIIEGLIAEKYVHREGRELVPVAKAFSLMELLHGLKVPELFSPELTAEWEFKLARMEKGELRREDFMAEIAAMTRHIVEQAKGYDGEPPVDHPPLAAPCPRCGGEIRETYKKYQCRSCEFGFWKVLAGRQIDVPEAEALLAHGAVGPLEGFRSRMGRPFVAGLKLNAEQQIEFVFANAPSGAQSEQEAPDLTGKEPLGACPKCAARVFELDTAYACEKAVGPDRSCDFRSGRVILQRRIEPEQVRKLLAEGRTDLLQRFVSKRGRPFSAYLVRQPDGKIGFEFEVRERKTPARGPRARAAGDAARSPTGPSAAAPSARAAKPAAKSRSSASPAAGKKPAPPKKPVPATGRATAKRPAAKRAPRGTGSGKG